MAFSVLFRSPPQEERLLRETRLRAAAEGDRHDGGGLDAVRAEDPGPVELHRCRSAGSGDGRA